MYIRKNDQIIRKSAAMPKEKEAFKFNTIERYGGGKKKLTWYCVLLIMLIALLVAYGIYLIFSHMKTKGFDPSQKFGFRFY